jgi:hypothetical protein
MKKLKLAIALIAVLAVSMMCGCIISSRNDSCFNKFSLLEDQLCKSRCEQIGYYYYGYTEYYHIWDDKDEIKCWCFDLNKGKFNITGCLG